MTFTHIQTIEYHDHCKQINNGILHLITPLDDAPRDAWHCWSLYQSTHKKLRKNALPLLETVQLRKMLPHLKEYKPLAPPKKTIQYPPPLHYKNMSNIASSMIPLAFVKSFPSTHSHCYRPIQFI